MYFGCMEELDTLDQIEGRPVKKASWSVRLLIISFSSFLLLFLLPSIDDVIRIPHRILSSILPFLFLLGIISSLIGFIFGFIERSRDKSKALVGIIGNGILLLAGLIFVIFIVYILTQPGRIGYI